MPQEFCVVQCAGCHAFQVQHVKKKKEFTCPVCHKKQSVLKCFAISHSAKDCRLYVSQMNEARGKADALEPEERQPLQPIQQQQQQAAAAGPSTTWEKFVGSDGDVAPHQQQQDDEQDGAFVTHVPDALKGGRHGRGSKASTSTRHQAASRKRAFTASTEEDDAHEGVHAPSKSLRMGSSHVMQQQQGWQQQEQQHGWGQQQQQRQQQQPGPQQPMQWRHGAAPLSNSFGGPHTMCKGQTQPMLAEQHVLQQQRPQGRPAPSQGAAGPMASGSGLNHGLQRQQQQQQQPSKQRQQPALHGLGDRQRQVQRGRLQQQGHDQQQLLQRQANKPAAAPSPAGTWSAFMPVGDNDSDGCSIDDGPTHQHAARWGAQAGWGQQQDETGDTFITNPDGW